MHSERDPALTPQVVLLDIYLPKLNGFEVLREIRLTDATRSLPVIILTSSRADSDMFRSYHLGANRYVCKPLDFEEFSREVRQLGVSWLLVNQCA
jgi:DNA-binding response OmpR family regulator